MNTLSINFSEERTVQLYTDDYSQNYRHYDEHFVTTTDFQHYVEIFEDICASFDKKINVLDIGCGSGRYFHILKNVAHLTGIDVAPGMIKAAHTPVRGNSLDIEEMNLITGNIYTYDFHGKKFDFIYSVGVLGGHAPLTPDLCSRIRKMLAPGGVFYVTAVDLDSRKNARRKMVEAVYPLLPGNIKRMLDERWKTNYLTQGQLAKLVTEAGFSRHEISRFATTDKGWQGVQLQAICYA